METTRNPIERLWLHASPLLLASKSAGRRLILEQTGIPFTLAAADVDERLLEAEIIVGGGGGDEIALGLAGAKGLAVRALKEQFVLGADQVASCEGRCFGKPADLSAAAAQLACLSGKTHRLHSAAAIIKNGHIIFQTVAHADLTMRVLSPSFIDAYVDLLGKTVLTTAGAYQIEGLGAHLFENVSGDHWTIIGLPILAVLDALRKEGALLS